MANKRITDLATTATTAAADDYIALDGTTNGTRRISALTFIDLSDYPEVANFAALPAAAAGNSGQLYICLAAQGVYFISRKPAGLYLSNGSAWSYVGDVPDGYFSDSVLTISDDADPTKVAQFQLSGITTGTTRTLTVPDLSGKLVLSIDGAITLTGQSLTGTSTTPALSIASTWNVGTATPTALLVNVTDTASGAGSLFADFQAGSVTKIRFNKAGWIDIKSAGASGSQWSSEGLIVQDKAWFSQYGAAIQSTATVGWSSGAAYGGIDSAFSRISAGLIGVGTGAAGSYAGSLKLQAAELAGQSLTGTSTTPALSIASTWNVGTTVVDAISVDITDTASGAASNLLNLKVGTVSRFAVGKSSGLTVPGSTTDSSIKAGVLELQSYGSNNAWLGDNAYFSGGFQRRISGAASLFYFKNGGFAFGTAPSGTGSFTPNYRFIVLEGGNFGIGSAISNNDSVNGALFVGVGDNVGIKINSPTARLHLPAGTATSNTAPLKFISGTLLTTPEAGAVEYLSGTFYLRGTDGLNVAGTTTPNGRLVLPMGEINYFSLTGTAVTITTASTTGTDNSVKVAPATALTTGAYAFDNGGANDGRLRYTGATTRMFHCAASVSFSGGNSDTFTIMFAKNGTVVTTSTIAMRKMGAGGDVGSTAINGMFELATNDYLEVFVANNTNADDPTFHSLNLFALGM